MAVGEGGFHIADAYVEIHADDEPFRREVAGLGNSAGREAETGGRQVGERLGRGIGDGADGGRIGSRITGDLDKSLRPRAQKSGGDAGDKLSQGFQLAMVRNSPLIAAAIAGALTAGAPVAVASVTTLFTAIAAAAVHGNIQVSTQFQQLTDHATQMIQKAGTVAIPFFLQAIHRLGDGVSALGPQFHTAFAALGPSIDSLTSGVLRFVQNAMPGMVHAVQAAQPIMAGLANLLGDVGQGLSDFFDEVATGTPAAGRVFTSLGQVLGAILPILGSLMSAGAQLAGAVLPPIAAAFSVVAGAVHLLLPVLPLVLGGFLALKAGAFLSTMLAGIATQMEATAIKAGIMTEAMTGSAAAGSAVMTGMGRMGTVVGTVGRAMPLITLAVIGLGLAFQASQQQTEDWAKALNEGGSAAANARQQIGETADFVRQNSGIGDTNYLSAAWHALWGQLNGSGAAAGFAAVSLAKTTQAQKDQLAAMDPLTRQAQEVTKAQNDYTLAVQQYGPASGQAAGAAVAFRDASAKQKAMQDQLNIAIHGVTQAMIDQADEALAAIDSNFALQHAQNQQRDAEIALADAIRQHGSASVEAHDAEQNYVESIYNTAKAAAQLKADQSGLTQGSLEYKNVLDSQLLASLQAVEKTLTGPEKAAVDGFIAQLQAAGVTSDTTGGKLDDLGNKKPTPQVKFDDKEFQQVYSYVTGAINTLGGKKPTPTAFLNSQPFGGAAASMNAMLTFLANRHVTPSASLIAYTLAAEQAINYTARDRVVHITTFTRAAVASGGKIGDVVGLAGRRFDNGGKLHGPGGPTDDLIPAQSMSGAPIRLSNTEWIINAAVSRAQGDGKMAALNAGQADIVPKGSGPSGGQATASLHIDELHVHIDGVFDFSKPDTIRTLAQKLDTALAELHRTRS